MNQSVPGNEKLNARMKRGTKSLFIWTLAWLLSTAMLAFGPKLIWDFNLAVTLFAVAANLLLGIKMLVVNKRHIDDMDEMQRRIQLNAMAISLGVTMILGTLYGLLEPAGLLESTPHPSNILFVLGISYLVGVFINFRKYA